MSAYGMIGRVDPVEWRARLEVLVGEALNADSADVVRAALQDEIDRLPGPPASLAPAAPVLGVDGCRAGWVGVVLRPHGPPTVHVGASVAAMVEQIREGGDLAVVAIDIPIGLPDHGARAADTLTRRALPGKASSVFPTATRAAYLAASYAEARERNVAATGGTSLSAQAWALGPRILEVDAWVRSGPTVAVIEVHPELCFARIAGRPVSTDKHRAEGADERRRLLEGVGITAPHWYRGAGFGEDDLLDACAAAWTAARFLDGAAESLPAEPEVFGDGLPAAIWV